MLLVAMLELAGIGLVVPLLSSLLASEAGQASSLGPFAWLSNYAYSKIAVAVFVVFLARGIVGYGLQHRIALFSHMHRAYLMERLLLAYQQQPLEYHLDRDVSRSVATIVDYTAAYCESTLSASLRLLTDVMMIGAIAVLLALTEPLMFLAVAIVIGLVLLTLNRWVRGRIKIIANVLTTRAVEVFANVNAALDGYRDIRVLGAERFFRQRLAVDTNMLATHRAWLQALATVPRYAIEVSVVGLLLLIGYFVAGSSKPAEYLVPVLASFAFGAIRIMPAATSLMRNLNQMRVSRPMLSRLAEDLRNISASPASSERTDGVLTPFDSVELRDVKFRYPQAQDDAIRGANLKIKRGEVVGLVGRSGAGKSTLADIILGLLTPSSGQLLLNGSPVNGRQLRGLAAYVPQSSFLIADTLRANIALGVDAQEIDEERVLSAVRSAQLQSLVDELPLGLDSRVGERGSTLSGGQKQRLALARAIYHQRPLIVLDEATSALDSETEQDLVDALDQLSEELTVVVIAHRETTLKHCDRILQVADGVVSSRSLSQ